MTLHKEFTRCSCKENYYKKCTNNIHVPPVLVLLPSLFPSKKTVKGKKQSRRKMSDPEYNVALTISRVGSTTRTRQPHNPQPPIQKTHPSRKIIAVALLLLADRGPEIVRPAESTHRYSIPPQAYPSLAGTSGTECLL